MKSDKTLTPWEMEVFQSDVLVPVRLRSVIIYRHKQALILHLAEWYMP